MNNFDLEFEEAIRFIAGKFASKKDLTKPTLFHSIRVGLYLYQKGFDKNICIGGLLHDVIEDTNTSAAELEDKFGFEITELVIVNSKDTSIIDRNARATALIEKCATHSLDSAVIKAADILDNIRYYRRVENTENFKTMIGRGRLLLEKENNNFQNAVFEELEAEINQG